MTRPAPAQAARWSSVARALPAAIGLLLLAAAAAAGWLALNIVYPDLETPGIRRVFTRVIIHATILLGLWVGLSRTEFGLATRVSVWLAVAVPFTLWLALVWGLAVNGAFRPMPGGPRVPALPIAIVAPVLVGLVLLMGSRRIAAVVDATPPSWLIAVQVYRIFGGIFLVSWARGAMPSIFALPAGIGDVLVGVLALPAALYVSMGTPAGRAAGIAWNLLGLADFAMAIAVGAMSSPGPLQVLSTDRPNLLLGTYPTVMTPAFTVPSSIILHVLSLWQLRRLARKPHADP